MDSIKAWQISNVTLMHGIKDYQEHRPNGNALVLKPRIEERDPTIRRPQYIIMMQWKSDFLLTAIRFALSYNTDPTD